MTEDQASVSSGEIQRCPECGSSRLVWDYDASEVVCVNCGFVVDGRIIDEGPEWRAFDEEQWEKRARAGAPLTFIIHDKGLPTIIDKRDRDVYGKRIPSDHKAEIYRLRKWQRRARISSANERNLAFALYEVTKIANNLTLPSNIIETATVIYRKAVKEQLIRGRSIPGISAAAIYIACRQCGLVRTLEDISAAANLNRSVLSRSLSLLAKELKCFIPPSEPTQYVSKISNQLMIRGRVCEITNKILKVAVELKLTSGRSPQSIAASALYAASVLCGEKITQREIAQIAHVTEVTIRNRYKELIERVFFTSTL